MTRWSDAVLADVDVFSKGIRADDRAEMEHMGIDLEESLTQAVLHGDVTQVAYCRCGDPVAIMGVQQHIDEAGLVWMFATDHIEEHPMEFLRWSRRWVDTQLEKWPRLYNAVWAKNKTAMKWLPWVGASFIRPIEFSGEPYWMFEITKRKDICVHRE